LYCHFYRQLLKNLSMNWAYRFRRYDANRMRRFADFVNLVVTGPHSGRGVREMMSGAYLFPETELSRKYLRR